ncbi:MULTISPECIES: hypothetical protein [Muribaculaceae]|jgi:hypothetical protein|uniref:hypothetical protein n=1 Tax=Muribaculaceae TaxID=2005473 RepID=UPI000EF5F7A3|nr:MULTISPECIES: hypothetical protein [Muribaculaceae]RLT76171.1 hypothetical protein D7V95_09805 [bacterium J10(2018)]RXE70898.1 hypothetical protein ED352_07810 [Muribaculaceae bacterium Isolate-002 (NCI)]
MEALEGLVTINGTDIWKEYGAFLTEEKRGGRENLTAIMTPAKAKSHVGVNIRELDGTKYSARLDVRSEERDVTLHFAIFARTREEWLEHYRAFITLLKQGRNGWLTFRFRQLGLTMRMFYVSSTAYKPLTYLWREGVQASRFKVTFKEPEPSF